MTPKRNVLFVCIGNACRSQMAEGFARSYGKDVMGAGSAGLSPLPTIPTLTRLAMEEKNIDLAEQYTKHLAEVPLDQYDLIVNMSGFALPPAISVPMLEWSVVDPFGKSLDAYRATRDEIEMRVQRLILDFRRQARSPR